MPAAGAHSACWGVTSLPLGLLLPGSCALPVGLSKLCRSLWQMTGPGWVVCRWVAFSCPFQAAQLPCPRHCALNRFHNHHPVPPCATGTSIHPWTSWLPCYPVWCSISGESASLPQLLAEGPGHGDGQKTRIWGWGFVPVSWHPASLLAVGGGVSQGTCLSLLSLIWTSPYFQVQVCDRDRCWGRSLRAGQVCGEPGAGMGWT